MRPSIPRPESGSSPFQGPGLSRRAFVELSAGGLVASWFLRSPAAAMEGESVGVTPRGTAKNAIFVFLPGAPSQIDTWDLKEGAWTPTELAPTDFPGGIRFPQGLLPQIASHLPDIAILRSCQSWALVHGLAQAWSQISRNPTGALGNVAPHIGSVVALEMQSRRNPLADVLPSFVALNTGSIVGSGYFASLYSPFSVQPSTNGLSSLIHPDGSNRFALRWSDLETLDANLRSGEPLGKDAADVSAFYGQAKVLVDSSDVNALFTYTSDESQRYGSTSFGNSCVVARKLLAGRRGARFIQVTLGGWDNHSNIYAKTETSLFSQAAQLDAGLGNLIADLKSTPGETSGRTLFDETLIVVLGEFGRTVGILNGQAGRDHFLRTSVLFAGGGVRGGRAIGGTDAAGAKLQDPGWSGNRDIKPEDLAATIYSALGIDWTTVRYDDPLKRGFEYVPFAKDGSYKPVDEIFG